MQQMLTNVLESLVRRTDLYNDETGEIIHPLLVEREEKNVLLIVIAGDKGFAGGFNSNIGKAAQKFITERTGKRPERRPRTDIGKKAIGFYKKRFPAANYEKTEEKYDNDLSTHYESIRHRAQQDRSRQRAPRPAPQERFRRRSRDRAQHHRPLRARGD